MSSIARRSAMSGTCFLLALPPEIRFLIWELVLQEICVLKADTSDKGIYETRPYKAHHICWNLGLYMTNRSIYLETKPVVKKNLTCIDWRKMHTNHFGISEQSLQCAWFYLQVTKHEDWIERLCRHSNLKPVSQRDVTLNFCEYIPGYTTSFGEVRMHEPRMEEIARNQ